MNKAFREVIVTRVGEGVGFTTYMIVSIYLNWPQCIVETMALPKSSLLQGVHGTLLVETSRALQVVG